MTMAMVGTTEIIKVKNLSATTTILGMMIHPQEVHHHHHWDHGPPNHLMILHHQRIPGWTHWCPTIGHMIECCIKNFDTRLSTFAGSGLQYTIEAKHCKNLRHAIEVFARPWQTQHAIEWVVGPHPDSIELWAQSGWGGCNAPRTGLLTANNQR